MTRLVRYTFWETTSYLDNKWIVQDLSLSANCEPVWPVYRTTISLTHKTNKTKSISFPFQSHLKRALLEVISSNVVRTQDDVDKFVRCTLLNAQSNIEHKHSSIKESLDFLKEYEFIRVQTDEESSEIYYTATRLGNACLSSSLPPADGLVLFSELQKSRRCFVLESELHAVYLVTPYSVSYQLHDLDWLMFLEFWEKLTPAMRKVGEIVGVSEAFLVKAMRGQSKLDDRQIKIHKRFYTALALNELVNETPINDIAVKYNCNRGLLQSLQQMASTFAGIVTSFCNALNFQNMSLILGQFKERLFFGVHRDLIDLMRIPGINYKRARLLFDGGCENLVALANSNSLDIEKLLFNSLHFETEKQNANENEYDANKRLNERNFFITGKKGMTINEAAKLFVGEARRFVQYEIGVDGIKWETTQMEEENISRKRKSTELSLEVSSKTLKESEDCSELKGIRKVEIKSSGSVGKQNESISSEKSKGKLAPKTSSKESSNSPGNSKEIILKSGKITSRPEKALTSDKESSSKITNIKPSSKEALKESSARTTSDPVECTERKEIDSKTVKEKITTLKKQFGKQSIFPQNEGVKKKEDILKQKVPNRGSTDNEPPKDSLRSLTPTRTFLNTENQKNSPKYVTTPKSTLNKDYKNSPGIQTPTRTITKPSDEEENDNDSEEDDKIMSSQNQKELQKTQCSRLLRSHRAKQKSPAGQRKPSTNLMRDHIRSKLEDKFKPSANSTESCISLSEARTKNVELEVNSKETEVISKQAEINSKDSEKGSTEAEGRPKESEGRSKHLEEEGAKTLELKENSFSPLINSTKLDDNTEFSIENSIIKNPELLNASHILSISKQETKSSSFDRIHIIDVCGNKTLFDSASQEILSVKSFGMCLAVERLPNKTRNLIGGNLLINQRKNEDLENHFEHHIDDETYLQGISISFGDNVSLFFDLQLKNHKESLEFLIKILSKADITALIFDTKDQLKALRKACSNLDGLSCKFEDPKVANWLLQPDKSLNLLSLAQLFAPECIGLMSMFPKNKGYWSIGMDHSIGISGKTRSSIEACVTVNVLKGQIENLKRIGEGELYKFFTGEF